MPSNRHVHNLRKDNKSSTCRLCSSAKDNNKCQGGIFTWYVAFTIQMNAYLFIYCDIEDGLMVVKWRLRDE